MERDEAAYRSDTEALQTGRYQLPVKAAPGVAQLGI